MIEKNPPKNTHFPLPFSLTHCMNFRWNATLFPERGQNFFMSLGRGWSKLSIKVIIASFPFRRFRSLPLILLFWYKSKIMSSRLQELAGADPEILKR